MSTLADRIGHIVSSFCGGNASEFARLIGVTPQYANQLIQGERANPSEAVRMRICATFGVTDRWLMEGGDPMMCKPSTELQPVRLWASSAPKTIRRTVTTMPNIPFADEIHAFLEDEENVEALTDAVQELKNIFINGTSDRPPVGIAEASPEFERRYMGRWQIGIDLSESRSFTPTKD